MLYSKNKKRKKKKKSNKKGKWLEIPCKNSSLSKPRSSKRTLNIINKWTP
jgi:hypothetical protein